MNIMEMGGRKAQSGKRRKLELRESFINHYEHMFIIDD